MTHRLTLRALAPLVVLLVAATAPAGDRDVQALAGRIDAHTAARWRERGVKPAAPADDAAYLRRAYLDLVGQVPTLTAVRDFLDDPARDKRARLVERLLATDASARFFAVEWRKALLAGGANQFAGGGGLDAWLQQRLHDNVGYDKIARQVLTAPGNDPALSTILQAAENKPENLAGAVARVFLGVRIECAQCHDHPFARWKKQQFWEFAAFFSDLRPGGRRGELTIPNTEKAVRARVLSGDAPPTKDGDSPRVALADDDDPRLIARAAVRGLTAEQMYDSLAVVTGKGAPLDQAPGRTIPLDGFGPRADFVARFSGRERPIEAQTSILQALHQMNGRPTADATSLQGNAYLRARAEAEGRTSAQRVEELFLLTLARKPRPEEAAPAVTGRRRWPTCSGCCSTAVNSC